MEGRTRGISRTGRGAALRALLAFVLAIGLMPAIPATALADDTESASPTTEPDVVQVGDLSALKEAATNGGKVELTADIEGVNSHLFINSGNELDIDLAGHAINMNGFSLVSNGGEIVIRDSTAGFLGILGDWSVSYSAGKITTSENAGTSPVTVQNGGTVDIRSGIVECVSTVGASAISCIGNQDPATWETQKPSSVSLNGGYVRGYAYGIYVSGNGASVLVNDGAVEAAYAAISGNGTVSNVKNEGGTSITVNGGYVIACDPNGPNDMKGCIYHPQDGSLVVNGGVLHAVNGFGILLRAGDLRITGGSVDATGSVSGKFADGSTTVSSNAVYLDYAADYPGAKSTPNEFEMTGGTVSCDESLAPVVKTDASAEGIETSEAITGGTLKGGEIADGLVVPGMRVDEDGKVVVDEQTAVATVGSVGYTTLSAAIAAASNGGTVVLQSDVTDSIVVDKKANVTIDLNGCTITNEGNNDNGDHTITNKGKLTIFDSSKDGAGTVDCVTHAKGALVNYGTAIVKGGKFTRSKEASKNPTDNGGNSWYVIDNRGTMTFDGGEVVNDSKLSSLVRNLNGKLTINAGKFENNFIALKNDEGGTLEVKGGVITSDEQSLQNWSVATLSGGTFNGRVATWGYTGTGADGDNTAIGKTTITGTAVVNGDVQAINYMKSKEPPSVTVSGGTVNGDVMKATHVGRGTNWADPDVDTSTIVVTGGSFDASGLNGDSLPYFMEGNVVAKSESGLYAVMERSDLQAGDYIVADGAPGITEEDLAEGLEVEYDEATGKWVVSKPAPPVVTKPSYDVTVDQPANGTVELSAKTAKEGQKVTVTVTPDAGFELASLVVADEDGNALELTENADGTYSFEMPAGDVTVHASFADAWENPFTDLGEDHWGYGAVRMANLLGLMNGYDGTTLFGPDDGLMREQAATVMWNLMGDGDVSRPEAPQADVDQSQWYAPYVNWAVDSKVMDGYSEDDFGVGDSLTREQFAAVIAKAVGADVDSADQAALGAFPDADGVSGWARATMAWAVENGVINGAEAEDGTRELQATRELTRAEMATMMVNAIEVGVLDFGA